MATAAVLLSFLPLVTDILCSIGSLYFPVSYELMKLSEHLVWKSQFPSSAERSAHPGAAWGKVGLVITLTTADVDCFYVTLEKSYSACLYLVMQCPAEILELMLNQLALKHETFQPFSLHLSLYCCAVHADLAISLELLPVSLHSSATYSCLFSSCALALQI